MRHFGRVFGSLLLALVLALSVCPRAGATTIEQAKQKQKELDAQKKKTQEAAAALSQRLNELIAQMTKTEKQLAAKQEQVDKAEEELALAKVKENDQYNDMKLRIRYMYEEGESALLTMLVESRSITDLLNRAEYASELSGYDRQMLETYKETSREIEAKEKKLKKEYEELETLQRQLSADRDQVQQMLDEKQVQLSDIEKQIGANGKELQRLVAEAERAKKLQAEAAAAKAKAGGAYSPGSAGAPKISGNGKFAHPCPGSYLSSGFGYRSFDHSFHKGYDFACHGKSMPTYAAEAGTVVIAGWSNSAGNWIVINHGNGLVTKYMHHSAIYVHAGQQVSKGQNIGKTGSTGYSSGVHLHFQVEVNGVAVNPGSYL